MEKRHYIAKPSWYGTGKLLKLRKCKKPDVEANNLHIPVNVETMNNSFVEETESIYLFRDTLHAKM